MATLAPARNLAQLLPLTSPDPGEVMPSITATWITSSTATAGKLTRLPQDTHTPFKHF